MSEQQGPVIASLVEQFYKQLYRYAYRLSGSVPDAEDLTQQTFLQAQSSLQQLRRQDRPEVWLFRILHNIYVHRFKTRGPKTVPLEGSPEPATVEEELFADDVAVNEKCLQDALNSLPEEYRSPVILFYLEGLSCEQVAAHLQVPVGTVLSRLFRGRQHLRKQLTPRSATSARPLG